LSTWTKIDESKSKRSNRLCQDFTKIAPTMKGLRLIKQDPTECLFSFLCSQNNNIKRISMMIQRLCNKYGSLIETLDGEDYYSFPTLEQLSVATESDLRNIGFGYRSAFVVSTVQKIKSKGGSPYLESLREQKKRNSFERIDRFAWGWP